MEAQFSKLNIGNEPTRKWSDLPKDILTRITLKLNWQTDLTRIRGVCPEWRSALPLSEYPLNINRGLIVPSLKPISSNLTLLKSIFYFLSPLTPSVDDRRHLAGNWVARIGELGPNKHIFNPLNLHNYFLPEHPLSASFNLLDCRTLELDCVYSLFGGSTEDDVKPVSKKVVGGWNLGSGYLFAVLAELENGGGLVYWKGGDENWTRMKLTDSFRVLDIVYHDGKFYVFELSGWRIGVIEPSFDDDSTMDMKFVPAPKILGEPINGSFALFFNGNVYILGSCHFVSSNGRLYLIFVAVLESDLKKENKGNVIVFVLKGDQWENVDSLGDVIFFIGYDASFSLLNSSSNLPQWKSNSICFFTHPFPMIFDYSSNGDLGKNLPPGAEVVGSINYAGYWRYFRLFELDEPGKGIVPFKKLSKKTYAGLFFPPPPWVKWRCPSRGNVEFSLDGLEFSG